MQLYRYPGKETWDELSARPLADHSSLEKSVRKILQKVKEKGDKAVRKFTKEFDGVSIKELFVTQKEIRNAASLLGDELKSSILLARDNIKRFHTAQQENLPRIETMPGVVCWRQSVAIEKVGLYVPGGSAPLFSTVLMLGVPAAIAGCREVILCTPPSKDGSVHPAILFAADACGITRIVKAGGVQAIAAMAFGTETIPKVFKIFGPGNQYVTLAKQLVQQQGIAIDIPAGPSEVLVIADETAVPQFVAADLLSQAEHGPDSQVILLTTQETIAEKVEHAIGQQMMQLPRKEIAKKALQNSKFIIVETLEEAIAFSNLYAPEHLILSCSDPATLLPQIRAAGSVFIGNYSPESAGDYASGTNHTLPTNGNASVYSGVSLDSFVKKITFQQLTREGLQNIGDTVMHMAEAEGLEAHKNAIKVRLNS